MTSVILPRQALDAVSQSADPKKAMIDAAGDLSGIEVMGNMVLVATFVRPSKTRGGIIRPDSNVEEDVWQGKVGLVLKAGPLAFASDDEFDFGDQNVSVGDWCVFKVGDGWQLTVGQWPCRLVRDSSIRLKVNDPSIVL
jgi:co-chaperonin GroES (HSP10)